MQCVAEAVASKGLRGLTEFVPGSSYLFDIATDAIRRMKDRRNRDQIRDDVRRAAEATMEQARLAAERIAREVASRGDPADRIALELYLTQIPGAVRRSLRRPEDPSGTTIPAIFRLETGDDLLHRLPQQLPMFRPGNDLPGRPGWTLLEPLGSGGFGEVWKVGHTYAEPWAVKFCTDATAKKQLLRHEASLVARVRKDRHPNVVPLIDAVLEGDAPWLAYEFVGGGDLTGLILGWQKLHMEDRLRQVMAALKTLAETAGHFHRLTDDGQPAPIVHRDLKPANILVKRVEGKSARLMVTDFGIGGIAAGQAVKAAQQGTTTHQRSVSMLAGSYTPLYAGPRQQRGDAADPRDDVHALGVIGYQMLTGRLDAAPGARFDRELRELGVPPAFIELIGDCVDTNPKQQPANGLVLAERLKTPASSPPRPEPRPDPRPEPSPTPTSGESGKQKSQPLPLDDEDDKHQDDVSSPPGQGNRFLGALGSVFILFQALLFCIFGATALYVFATTSDANEPSKGNTVAFMGVIAITSVLNAISSRRQPARRKFRLGVLSWSVLIGFVVIQVNTPRTYYTTRSYSTYSDSYTRSQVEQSNKWARETAERTDKEVAFARGMGVCGLEIVLTVWFIRGRPKRGQQAKMNTGTLRRRETRTRPTGVGTLSVRRKWAFTSMLVSVSVEIDGVEEATLSNGAKAVIPLAVGEHEVKLRAWFHPRRTYTVRILPDHEHRYQIRPGAFFGFVMKPVR